MGGEFLDGNCGCWWFGRIVPHNRVGCAGPVGLASQPYPIDVEEVLQSVWKGIGRAMVCELQRVAHNLGEHTKPVGSLSCLNQYPFRTDVPPPVEHPSSFLDR